MASTSRLRARPVVVVTGGSAGVGRAAVREFARGGYDVAILARGRAGLGGAVGDVERAGRRGLGVPTDVADPEAVEAAAARVEEELGGIDVWVNVAFVGTLAPFVDTDLEAFRRVTEVTYYGQVYGTRAALARMRPRGHGVIINVGSAMAYRSIPLQSAYCGAKHAIKGFTESVATELVHERSAVRVCMVQLPGLNTPQFTWNLNQMPQHPIPVPPVFAPELPARAIRFLAELPRRNMWVGFSTAYTILAERLAPALVDAYLGRTGVAAQQTDQNTPRHPANVFSPSDEEDDRGPHGPFPRQTRRRDPQLWLSMHRRAVLTGLAGTTAATAATAAARRGR
jgi:NAD(P)-dependent dehydrogenase (short-subunit alcohol dehydrogenase family)